MHLRNGLIAISLLLATPALAENWISSGDAEIDAWYEKAQRNPWPGAAPGATGGKCCGKSDAFWADKSETVDGQWIVTVTDERIIQGRKNRNGQRFVISPDVIDKLRQGNPTGHVVIFILNTGGDLPFCFFPGDGV
jgi:hypothetical protein